MRSYGGISQELKKGCLQQKVCVAVCCSVLQCVAVCCSVFVLLSISHYSHYSHLQNES